MTVTILHQLAGALGDVFRIRHGTQALVTKKQWIFRGPGPGLVDLAPGFPGLPPGSGTTRVTWDLSTRLCRVTKKYGLEFCNLLDLNPWGCFFCVQRERLERDNLTQVLFQLV